MSENTKKVDLVIVIDTSGSMKSTAEEISKAITGAVDEAKNSCPSDLRVDYLGIEGTFENTKFDETVRNYLTSKLRVDAAVLKSRVRKSLAGAGANEDGARATEDVSEHYDWREGAERAIFLLQDESLDGGEMIVTPAAIKANDNAIATALQHNVKVSTYLGAPHTPYPTQKDEEAMIEEFKRLASKTGGESYIHTSGLANFKEMLTKTICVSKVSQDERIDENEKGSCGCEDQRWGGYLAAVKAEGIYTGIQVKKGDVIDILASGFAKYGASYPWHGPQGDIEHVYQKQVESGYVKPGETVGKLLMKIGNTLTAIGTGVQDWVAPSDGEIIFLYNDTADNGHGNNEGGFDIKLKVTSTVGKVAQRWDGHLPAVKLEGINTGIQVKKGNIVDILASGFAKYGSGFPWHGPQGDIQHVYQKQVESGYVKPGETVGKLLVKIGDTLTAIGSGVQDWNVPNDGEVVFFYNDTANNGHGNNEGGFDIKLKVK